VTLLSVKTVRSILGDNDSYRGDCPDCGGKNSFSVNKNMGEVAWICFKASCRVRGRETIHRSVDEIVCSLLKPQKNNNNKFEVPKHFTSIHSQEEIYTYFQRVNAISLFESGAIKLQYDPKQDRAVFMVERDGVVIDAIGRSLNKNNIKWHRYGSSGKSFLHKRDRCGTIIVTEDIPSAITVGYSYSSMGLMGTDLSHEDMSDIIKFQMCIIALDPDAYSKSIRMAQRLSPWLNTKAILIPDDLKYYKPKEAKAIVDGT